jgi:hypothetical protein
MEDYVVVSPAEMVKFRPTVGKIDYDSYNKEEKIDSYIQYLDMRRNYMK